MEGKAHCFQYIPY